MIKTEDLHLMPFSEKHYEAIFSNDTIRLGELLNVNTPDNWTTFNEDHEAIHFLYKIFKSLADEWYWGSYFITIEGKHELIGTCGFKGKPDANNYVEIGYEINPVYQNKGFATQASKSLIEFAFNKKIK